jgi:30S ribosomal protein 3
MGIAIDHIVDQGYSPLSSYFFWPYNDAWTQIKTELESKPWISETDKIDLLNQTTLIINYWQENKKNTSLAQIKKLFPDLIFCGDY